MDASKAKEKEVASSSEIVSLWVLKIYLFMKFYAVSRPAGRRGIFILISSRNPHRLAQIGFKCFRGRMVAELHDLTGKPARLAVCSM